jgi:primosomal protein N' (replication factor Y)
VDIKIIGPAPAFVARLRGRYRWQMILRGNDIGRLFKDYNIPSGWAIDVDPVGLN